MTINATNKSVSIVPRSDTGALDSNYPDGNVPGSGFTPASGFTGSGTFEDDGKIVIVKAAGGLGSTPTLTMYDDFRSLTHSESYAGVSASPIIGSWSTEPGVFGFTANDMPNNMGARIIATAGATTIGKINLTTVSEVFVSYLVQNPSGYRLPNAPGADQWPSTSDHKGLWLIEGDGAASTSVQADVVLLSFQGGSNLMRVGSNDPSPLNNWDDTNQIGWGGVNGGDTAGWHGVTRMSWWLKANDISATGVDGFFQAVTEGLGQTTQRYNDYKRLFNPTHRISAWSQLNVPGYVRSTAGYPEDNLVIGQLYVATGENACNRWEIGDTNSYSACKKLSLCTVEGQTDTTATLNLRLGILPGIAGAHLFHVGSENTASYVGAIT